MSRKGAKAQRKTAVHRDFLCAFAPLRDNALAFMLSSVRGCANETYLRARRRDRDDRALA